MKKEGETSRRLSEEFIEVGRMLFEAGLNNSHSGNMSVRMGDRILITRRGSMLGRLAESDLIEVGLAGDDPCIALASTELRVHRAVYRVTSHRAVVHAHPRMAVAFSMCREVIVPADEEGRYCFNYIPVLNAGTSIGSPELENALPPLLMDVPVVAVRGHGTFAAGASLEEGLRVTHSLEWSCGILVRCLALGMKEEELLGDQAHREG